MRRLRHASSVSVKLYRNCLGVGIVMLFLNIAMATMIVYTIITSRAKNHSLVVIYFLAIYSVSVFVFNTASMIITRKQRLPYSYIIARILSFCASFMSLFNFVNSLVYTLEIRRCAANSINTAVGAAVIVSVLFLSVSVIYKCNKRISEYKNARS